MDPPRAVPTCVLRWFFNITALRLKTLKMAPRWPQEGPKRPQEAPKRPQEGPTRPQDGPKTAPRRPQDGSKTAPSRFQDAFKNDFMLAQLQHPPKGPQDPPGSPPGPPQDAPKRPQEGPKRAPRGRGKPKFQEGFALPFSLRGPPSRSDRIGPRREGKGTKWNDERSGT